MNPTLVLVLSLVISFGGGWAAAVAQDITGQRAIAAGVVALAAYFFGKVQQPVIK